MKIFDILPAAQSQEEDQEEGNYEQFPLSERLESPVQTTPAQAYTAG